MTSKPTTKIYKAQIIKLHTLLPPQIKDDKAEKQDWVKQFTQDERSSIKDMNFDEANKALEWLGAEPYIKRTPDSYYASFDSSNIQHRAILSLCHQIGWVVYHPKLAKNVPDLNTLGIWMKETGYLHKSLKAYTAQELPKLVKQFENVVLNYVK